jgi:hypothetical protein
MTAKHFENLARQISHFHFNNNYNSFFFGAITITI